MTLLGRNVRDPLGPPTWTMCVVTMPSGAEPAAADPVDKTTGADNIDEGDCAAAKPMRADRTTDCEKNMFADMGGL